MQPEAHKSKAVQPETRKKRKESVMKEVKRETDILKTVAEELTAQNSKINMALDYAKQSKIYAIESKNIAQSTAATAVKSKNQNMWPLLISIASLVVAATAVLIAI